MTRYSQLYVERGRRIEDSPRARRRLSAWCLENLQNLSGLYRHLEMELGFPFQTTQFRIAIPQFFDTAHVEDFLDACTEVFKIIDEGQQRRPAPDTWVTFVDRVFCEEHLAYRIDKQGIVHPFVDAEFEINQRSALEALAEPRFGEARRDLEAAFRHLRDGEGKAAIRSMFPAFEAAAKVLFPGAMSRLMPNEVDRYFVPRLQAAYAGNQPAIDAGTQLLLGLKAWVISAQPYRHGQELERLAEPPKDFVIAFLSNGAAYLRWSIELFAPTA